MSSLTPFVVVGLGNPGQRYARTRHNAGYMVLDVLAAAVAKKEWRREGPSLICQIEIGRRIAVLAKPLTFMNRSGEAARTLIGKYGLTAQEMILIVDDFNLPFGRIRIRKTGSAGGHNGLLSIIQAVGTRDFIRVRLGIGEEGMPADKADFVLEDFPPQRDGELKEMIIRAGEAVRRILSDGISKAMSEFNA